MTEFPEIKNNWRIIRKARKTKKDRKLIQWQNWIVWLMELGVYVAFGLLFGWMFAKAW